MYNQLILDAFEKAKHKLDTDKITHISRELSEFIQGHSNEPYGERTLRDHYNKALDGSEETVHLRTFAADALSVYLGYSDYSEYKNAHSPSIEKYVTEISRLKKRNRVVIICSLIVILGLLLYQVLNKQHWMVWDNDHYVESKFDIKKLNLGLLKIRDDNLIDNFRKIEPTCNYVFFNPDGSPRVWYGKNIKKDYEYFTSFDEHPETKKTLKEITQYIIDNHICK
ncbi:hypothetical protein AB9K26_02320 [Psychroserpens sp. XS_ASV72]|uniref:hypothetical protein n=1 Tax=Psychroserpens sp. XS_ASV72 TaxID=3241293 RepID=UPI0035149A28